MGKGLLAIFLSVNMNPGSDPEDMVSVRLFVTADRAVSVRTRMLLSVQTMREDVAAGEGARTAPGVLARLAENLARRIGPVIQTIEERMDGLEAEIGKARTGDLRRMLRDLRREAIALRRYLAPQRDAIALLPFEETSLLNNAQRGRLPLGFITGLLGVNVGGIPRADSPFAFALLCAILVSLVGLEIAILRRLRWI